MADAYVEISADNIGLFVPVYVDAFSGPPWNVRWRPASAEERLRSFCQHPRARGLGLIVEGDPAGFALGWGERWMAGWVFHIKELCIAPALQRQGRGTQLLQRFEAALVAASYCGICLETSEAPASRRFYENAGYDSLGLVTLRKRLTPPAPAA